MPRTLPTQQLVENEPVHAAASRINLCQFTEYVTWDLNVSLKQLFE